MDKRFIIFFGLLYSNIAISQEGVNVDIEKSMRIAPEVPLSGDELKAYQKLKKLENSEDTRVELPNGTIEYLYDYGVPTVLCRFLDSCSILLEKGETLGKGQSSFHLSDGRIQIVPMVDDVGGETRSMILVSPVVPGITANLHIRTDKRIYRLKVKSTNNISYGQVSFRYKKDLDTAMEAYQKKLETMKKREKFEPKKEYDYSYSISGDAKWKPQKVYFTGQKTVIEFSEDFSLSKRPTLFSVKGDKREFVEYRVEINKFIVDYKLENAVLAISETEVSFTHKDYKEETISISSFGSFGDGF